MTQIADLVAPLVVLAENGIPTDVQELLVQGDARRGIAPGSLEKAMSIYAASLIQSQAARIAELEAGLEPFNAIAMAVFRDGMNGGKADAAAVWGFDNTMMTYGHLRAARSLLNGERKEEPQPTSRALRRDDWHYDSDGYCDNPGRGY